MFDYYVKLMLIMSQIIIWEERHLEVRNVNYPLVKKRDKRTKETHTFAFVSKFFAPNALEITVSQPLITHFKLSIFDETIVICG